MRSSPGRAVLLHRLDHDGPGVIARSAATSVYSSREVIDGYGSVVQRSIEVDVHAGVAFLQGLKDEAVGAGSRARAHPKIEANKVWRLRDVHAVQPLEAAVRVEDPEPSAAITDGNMPDRVQSRML